MIKKLVRILMPVSFPLARLFLIYLKKSAGLYHLNVCPTFSFLFFFCSPENNPCRDVGLCSSDCVGPSCVSYDGIEGVCAFEAADMATCEVFGTTNAETVEYDDTTCLVTSISTEQQCVSVSFFCFFSRRRKA